MNHSDTKSVLVISVGALGDLLVSTAAIFETTQFFSNAKISLLGNLLLKEIFDPRQWPSIEKIWCLTKSKNCAELYTVVDGVWKSTGQVSTLYQICKQYEVSINLRYESMRFAIPALLARVPVRVGTSPAHLKFVYTHSVPWLGKDPIIHERDIKLYILNAILNKSEQNKTEGFVKKWKNLGLPKLLAHTKAENNNYILINPTSSRREKAWDSDKFKQLAEKISSKSTSKIAIIGSPQETAWLKEVAGERFEILQPSSILELAQIVNGAKLLITNTSSMQFIAASEETHVLTLMGRPQPEVWGPLGGKAHFMRGTKTSDMSEDIFEQDHQILNSISVDRVFEFLSSHQLI